MATLWNVRLSDRAHLIQLARALEWGTLNRSDAVSLFMLMREEAPNGTAIKDIGHTVAHDNRDRGTAHRHVNDFADSIMTAAREGGLIVSRVLFPVEEIIAETASLLSKHRITLDESRVHAHSKHLVSMIADILDGTVIVMGSDDTEAELHGGRQPSFTLRLKLFGGLGIAGPMLIG